MAIARSEPFRDQVCPLGVCDGSGWILGPEDVARECECRAERLERARSRGVASKIPQRYSGVSFDRPPVSDMAKDLRARHGFRAAQNYLEDLDENLVNGTGLWFMGNTGTGKTSLGMLIAKEAMSKGKTVAIYFTPKLLTEIRKTYQAADSNDAYDKFFRRLSSVDLLYLDDLGSERHTDWVVEQLYALVNERYEIQGSTIVTSNAPYESDVIKAVENGQRLLAEQIGMRTVSRLVQMCAEPVPLFGPDKRTEIALSAA